jgi:hypothetical protein
MYTHIHTLFLEYWRYYQYPHIVNEDYSWLFTMLSNFFVFQYLVLTRILAAPPKPSNVILCAYIEYSHINLDKL